MMTVPTELLEARVQEYRIELAKKDMQLVRYRLLLEQYGIEPPDSEGAELVQMYRDCRAVISTASEFVKDLGSARELMDDWGR